MKFILGKKLIMSQIFDDAGAVHPVTWVEAGPVVVAQIRTKEKDGYEAVQVGLGTRREKSATKALKGHTKNLTLPQFLREFRVENPTFNRGDVITVATFDGVKKVSVSSISKGKGFQGVVKRHGFAGGSRTHGQKHSEREPGSISGGGRAGGKVSRGMRMAGRMGGERVTVDNIKIVSIIPDQNLMALEGALPGNKGNLVEIRSLE